MILAAGMVELKMNTVYKNPLSEKTKVCVSISLRPGSFGARFHNFGFKLLGLNQIYIPLKIQQIDFPAILDIMRNNFWGCSVSMPYKALVMKYIDTVDEVASKVGAVNTIVNNSGVLKGHNTDVIGARIALEKGVLLAGKTVLLLGAGGVASAIAVAVKSLGGCLIVSARNNEQAIQFSKRMQVDYLPWEDLANASGYLIINATPVGMNDPNSIIVAPKILENFASVFDVVQSPLRTRLIKIAKSQGKTTISGQTMCVYQAAEQFKLYTGQVVPGQLIQKALAWQ